jgi:hypothetical protein
VDHKGITEDLVARYAQAIEITKTADQVASQCLEVTELASRIPKLDNGLLLMLAKAKIDLDTAAMETAGETALENRSMRDEIVGAILTAPNDQTYKQVVDATFAGQGAFKILNAGMQATLMTVAREQLQTQLLLASVAQVLPPIWRYIFYRAMIEDVGSDLQRRTKRDKEIELLKELGITLVEKLTHIDLIGVAKELFASALQLYSKERAMEEMIADMAAKNRIAREYVDLYSAVVSVWGKQTAEANWIMTKNVQDFLELYVKLGQAFQDARNRPIDVV